MPLTMACICLAAIWADGLSNRNLFVLGMVLQVIGCYLIAEMGGSGLYWGLMMGCWMMVTGVASVLAGYVSGLMPQNSGSTPQETNLGYRVVFNERYHHRRDAGRAGTLAAQTDRPP